MVIRQGVLAREPCKAAERRSIHATEGFHVPLARSHTHTPPCVLAHTVLFFGTVQKGSGNSVLGLDAAGGGGLGMCVRQIPGIPKADGIYIPEIQRRGARHVSTRSKSTLVSDISLFTPFCE